MRDILGIVACAVAIWLCYGALRQSLSPEFKRDLERLRDQRRARKAARR
jgi:hypothetical protein